MKLLYFDYNATTPIDPEVRDAMLPYLADQFGNPSSSHRMGLAAAEAVAAARDRLAELLHCNPAEVFFTSGGTESSNLAIRGTFEKRCSNGSGHLILSAIEHPATVEPARWLERRGYTVTVVGCDHNGLIRVDEIEAALRQDTVLVSVMHSNNEVGTIQPVAAIAEICRSKEVTFHVDAAQSTGKVAVDVNALGVDLLTLAGHKCYAPKGVGALYVRRGIELEPLLRGGGQERGLRPGTENVPHIVALGVAAQLAHQKLDRAEQTQQAQRDRLQAGLVEAIGDGCTVNAIQAARLPNTLSINFPGVVGSELLEAVPDLCASTGAACHSGETRRSATLAAMGVPETVARGTVRLSLGRFTTDDDVDDAIDRLTAAWNQLATDL